MDKAKQGAVFTLIGGAGDAVTAGIALLLFISGFWGVASLFVFVAFISTERARATLTFDRKGKGFKIGANALVWTAVCLVNGLGVYPRLHASVRRSVTVSRPNLGPSRCATACRPHSAGPVRP